MKVLTVVGARPQFIKSGPVSQALAAAAIEEVLVHTGQHYDPAMSKLFFDELGLVRPRHELAVGSGSHGHQTGRMLAALEDVMNAEAPDWVFVYGDTNSTIAGALAAAKLHLPVAHVEAGLRSFNRLMPEEINRVLTDHLSSVLFAPTATAIENLRREGIMGDNVVEVGDVMFDAMLSFAAIAESRSSILRDLGISSRQYALATIHRAENTDDKARLSAIFVALARVSADVRVVLPLHPRTAHLLNSDLRSMFAAAGGLITEPVGYLDMMMLERHASVILTDSGGVQKEAFFHRVPCVTLRKETEWVELVESGWNCLVDPVDAESVRRVVTAAMGTRGRDVSLYGAGNAASAIVAHLVDVGRVDVSLPVGWQRRSG